MIRNSVTYCRDEVMNYAATRGYYGILFYYLIILYYYIMVCYSGGVAARGAVGWGFAGTCAVQVIQCVYTHCAEGGIARDAMACTCNHTAHAFICTRLQAFIRTALNMQGCVNECLYRLQTV